MNARSHAAMVLDHLADRLRDRPPGPLYVGFSGGLDSSVLAHALIELLGANRVVLLHVDHQLQAASAAWALSAQRFAADLAVDCRVLQVTVNLGQGSGLEAAARAARYAAFAEATADNAVIALAHHRQDQAETLLLRLMQASGSGALGGMREARRFGAGRWLWRPLLGLDRQALHNYARSTGIVWQEDPANARCDLDRNWLRHRVLPALMQRWPQACISLGEAAARFAAEDEDRRQLAAIRLAEAATLDARVRRWTRWTSLDVYALGEVLRIWCRQLGHPVPPASLIRRMHLQLQASDTRSAKGDGFILGWESLELRTCRDLIRLAERRPPLQLAPQPWTAQTPLKLPGNATLEIEPPPALAQCWKVGSRQGGERLRLAGRSHSSALKTSLHALGLPTWEREQLPLIWSAEGRLLAAGDVLLSAEMESWLKQGKARLRWNFEPKYADETPAEG